MVPGLLIGIAGGALLSRCAIGVIYSLKPNPYHPAVYTGCVVRVLASGAIGL
jgi:hypothetical protein